MRENSLQPKRISFNKKLQNLSPAPDHRPSPRSVKNLHRPPSRHNSPRRLEFYVVPDYTIESRIKLGTECFSFASAILVASVFRKLSGAPRHHGATTTELKASQSAVRSPCGPAEASISMRSPSLISSAIETGIQLLSSAFRPGSKYRDPTKVRIPDLRRNTLICTPSPILNTDAAQNLRVLLPEIPNNGAVIADGAIRTRESFRTPFRMIFRNLSGGSGDPGVVRENRSDRSIAA